MDISVDDERTLTMIQDVYASDVIQETLPVPVQEYGIEAGSSQDIVFEGATLQGSGSELPGLDAEQSKKVEDNKEKILAALQSSLNDLTSIGEELRDFAMLHQRSRHIVSVEKLLELAGSKCAFEVNGFPCLAVLNHSTHKVGGNVEVTSRRINGHSKKWVSSEVLSYKQGQPVYLNDALLPAAILVSGNNYDKFGLLCKALGLSIISKNTFMRFQKHCAAPVIEEVWGKMNELVKKAFKDFEGVCLCGDGRNDSPGHSARYCVYTIMEHFTNVVVDFEVVDKRETGGNSTTMEKEALRRLLERMAAVFPFDELTTDASPSIIKLVRDLKGM